VTGRQPYRQKTERQIQTYTHTDRQAGRETYVHTDRQTGRQEKTYIQSDIQTDNNTSDRIQTIHTIKHITDRHTYIHT